MKRIWHLNLGGELQLEGRATPARAQARMREAAAGLVGTLVPTGETVLPVGAAPGDVGVSGDVFEGRAFVATAEATEALCAVGARVHFPSATVVRRVNGRTFGLPFLTLAGAHFLNGPPPQERAVWKSELSFAGRGHRRLEGSPTEADLRWLEAARSRGPVLWEPWASISQEVGVPGYVFEDGRVVVGQPVTQEVHRGQWVCSQRASPDEVPSDALRRSCGEVGEALHGAGYFGPYNSDAHHSMEHGWTLVSEVNARYSMGWALGWPEGRPDLT